MQNVWIKSPLSKNNIKIISNKITASPKMGVAVFMFDVIYSFFIGPIKLDVVSLNKT